jgi:hypothetical protein
MINGLPENINFGVVIPDADMTGVMNAFKQEEERKLLQQQRLAQWQVEQEQKRQTDIEQKQNKLLEISKTELNGTFSKAYETTFRQSIKRLQTLAKNNDPAFYTEAQNLAAGISDFNARSKGVAESLKAVEQFVGEHPYINKEAFMSYFVNKNLKHQQRKVKVPVKTPSGVSEIEVDDPNDRQAGQWKLPGDISEKIFSPEYLNRELNSIAGTNPPEFYKIDKIADELIKSTEIVKTDKESTTYTKDLKFQVKRSFDVQAPELFEFNDEKKTFSINAAKYNDWKERVKQTPEFKTLYNALGNDDAAMQQVLTSAAWRNNKFNSSIKTGSYQVHPKAYSSGTAAAQPASAPMWNPNNISDVVEGIASGKKDFLSKPLKPGSQIFDVSDQFSELYTYEIVDRLGQKQKHNAQVRWDNANQIFHVNNGVKWEPVPKRQFYQRMSRLNGNVDVSPNKQEAQQLQSGSQTTTNNNPYGGL